LTRDGLPKRTPEAEKKPKDHSVKIFEDYFLLGVIIDNIAVAHFKSNSIKMFVRFLEFGPDSPHDLVLRRSIHPYHKKTKIYARICECRADMRITFLLRCCQRNNIVSGIHIARSGQFIAKIYEGLNENNETLWKQKMFDTEEDVRAIMSKKCKEDEEKRDTAKGKTDPRNVHGQKG
jgi:hypothetical protein